MLVFEDLFNEAACVKSRPPERTNSAASFPKVSKSNFRKNIRDYYVSLLSCPDSWIWLF